MSLLQGLTRVDRLQLSDDEKAQISNHIGVLASMACSVSEATADYGLPEGHVQNLAYTSSLLAEIIGELNGLLQS